MNLTAILPPFLQAGFVPRQSAAAPCESAQRTLAHRALLRLENKRQQVQVLSGCLWLTRDGCPADIVLNAGDVFEQQIGAPVLLFALEAAEYLIADAGPNAQNRQLAGI